MFFIKRLFSDVCCKGEGATFIIHKPCQKDVDHIFLLDSNFAQPVFSLQTFEGITDVVGKIKF